MSFDGFLTHALVKELGAHLIGGKVAKIYQPFEQELQLVVRSQRQNFRLLISIHPQYYRLHLTDERPSNPEHAPMFCMLLRKHLEQAVLLDIQQVENDRILELHFTGRDELGDSQVYRLIIELMGRHSNVILVNGQDRIIDCLKHVPMALNSYRLLQPGADYRRPPQDEHQVNLFKLSQAERTELAEHLASATSPGQVQARIQGLGRLASQSFLAQVQKGASWDKLLADFCQAVDAGGAYFLEADKPDFYMTPLPAVAGQWIAHETLSGLIAFYYAERVRLDRIKQMTGDLNQRLQYLIDRNQLKLANLDQDQAVASESESYRIKGELLSAYAYQIQKGQTQVALPNYYDNNQVIEIELDPRKTAIENSQAYFKRYTKYRDALKHIALQRQLAQEEIAYLESVQVQLSRADLQDVAQIRLELAEQGYLSAKQQNLKKRRQEKGLGPRLYQASDGTRILVGRNNLQNDQLSLKQANKNFWWLHAKNIPGSHVIIESDQPSDTTLTEAAILAAFYSKFQQSANVPVDYLQVKHLRKPNGAKPGYVIYEGQKTLSVTPSLEAVEAMEIKD